MPNSTPNRHAFADALKRGLYEAIFRRRDIREFISDPIPDEVIARVLIAAHHAASVGFSQPWDFILVRSSEQRRRVKEVFEAERQKNADQFSGERREKYLSLKLAGIRDVEMSSACLAVENMWLTARAEGLGMGWVSIMRNDAPAEIFATPDDLIPIAYLCIGYVREFPDRPILASADWAQRLPPKSLIHFESWDDANDRTPPAAESLLKKIDDHSIWVSIFPEDSRDEPPSRE